MVDLPRYVKAQAKPNGRLYFYYERNRNTPRAWPRLALPPNPHSPDFWTVYERYEALEAVCRDQNWTFAWVAVSGRSYELTDPRGPGGITAFWAAIERAVETEQLLVSGEGKTFRALVAQFRDSPSFPKGISTQRDYNRYLKVVLDAWADIPVTALTTPDVQAAIDAYSGAPASGRYFRAVLSRLISFGVPRGYSSTNVVEHAEKPMHEAEPYKPWPGWALEAFFEHARVDLQLAVFSALYTGQRSVDVIPMARPRVDAGAIELIARKTGAKVFVPIHSEYRQVIAAAKIVLVKDEERPLHLREDGKPWTLAGYRTAWQREMTFGADAEPGGLTPYEAAKATAMRRLREAGLVFHGLRKNAVNMLLEVGCTEEEVSAIVEMSPAMVRHYARDVNKRRLAVNAMRKLEEGWAAMRPVLFGARKANK